MLIALHLVDSFVASMNAGEYWEDLVWHHKGTAFQTTDTNHETQMQNTKHKSFMIISLNFCPELFMNFKQELQRVLHDSFSDSLCF